MKFPFCQNKEKLDLIMILSFLLYNFSKEWKVEKRKFSRFCDTQLSTVRRLP